jgi:hypothetical protein
MKNRILIYSDSGKRNDFIRSVNDIMLSSNKLIQAYNSYQDFTIINTLQDFEELFSDPLGMFDKTILQNIDIKAKGNKQPDPAVLSSLFQIDRPGYLAAIGQSGTVIDADCPDCAKKTQSIKVSRIKYNAEYNQFASYLLFVNGFFQLNNNAINEFSDTFNVYAESQDQIDLYNHWQSVCNILNAHNKKYPLGSASRDQISKALKLQQAEGKFVINNISLAEQIKFIQL